MNTDFLSSDYRNEYMPVWCPGCGDYAVLKAFTEAFAKLKFLKENIVMVSGIGCSSRIPGYFTTYGFNSVHGRALPIASGLKAARPDLTVVAVGGDGDGFSIGGGHILHTIRRNTSITYMVIDNNIYGLTKGQASPTTTNKYKKEKGLAGPNEVPINPMHILFSYDAPFLARVNSTDVGFMSDIIVEAIRYPGFSFIHCLAACVTYQGKTFPKFIKGKSWKLDEKGHDPSDHDAAARIARNEPYAMGIVYKKS